MDIRLAGGNDTAGRVEVLYNGQWGTICDDYLGMLDAEVVCRQLNLGPPLAFTKKAVPFGKGTGEKWAGSEDPDYDLIHIIHSNKPSNLRKSSCNATRKVQLQQLQSAQK